MMAGAHKLVLEKFGPTDYTRKSVRVVINTTPNKSKPQLKLVLMKSWCFLLLLECQVALAQSVCGGKRNGARKPKAKQVLSNNVEKLPGFSNKDKDCILEMAFLLDSSEDVGNYYHEQQKKFVLETVNKMKGLQLTSGHTLQWKMSLLQYSSTVLMKQTFHSWEGPEDFQSHVASITPTGPGAYMTYAITNLTWLYKTESIPGSAKVAVLFIDGAKHARNTDISAASRKAKNQGIIFLVVGLSSVAEETASAAILYRLARVPASQVVFSLQEKEVVEKVLKKTKELTEEKCLQTSACLCEKGERDFPCPANKESLVLLYEDYEEKHKKVKQLPISSVNLQENTWNPQCQLNLDQGSCRVYVIKWYYDKKANACAQFWYGGCNGNANRFNSEDECIKTCVFFHGGTV
ncbi:collagen alpha-1(XXVIII) chain-like [Trichosurus vulpecula]|uniref:collagen alpha-1(XXVIII) chain-like n=1 Tax=Trichosurus vulpecula TaxID=9337 RepID=UPI00186B357F|nr:collagen alpha-1(XXVIII) chain-like [Trichosurus vulpecula]